MLWVPLALLEKKETREILVPLALLARQDRKVLMELVLQFSEVMIRKNC